MNAPHKHGNSDMPPPGRSPRPRVEGKVLIGVAVVAAIILALFLFVDFGFDTAPVESTPGNRGLQAPSEVYPPEPAIPSEVPTVAPEQ